jgi:hypothetical protein
MKRITEAGKQKIKEIARPDDMVGQASAPPLKI